VRELLGLIGDYLRAVEECLCLFDSKFGRRDLVRAKWAGDISQHGRLSKDAEYHLHGIGCTVEFLDHEVDFDFANLEGDVGFDAWRLWRYAKQFPDQYPSYQEEAAIKGALAVALTRGVISRFDDANRPFGKLLQLRTGGSA
jgi:uncharacterized protein DUF6896